ncbi:MAG: hypothetical protein KGH56_01415 [Patescibacteria group bacterium]|nr:hypothetical protein [Patescibacteria group bacterium]
MTPRIFNGTIAALLAFVLVTPAAFFAAPPRASADAASALQALQSQGVTTSGGTAVPALDTAGSFTPGTSASNAAGVETGLGPSSAPDFSGGGDIAAADAGAGTEGAGCLALLPAIPAAVAAGVAGGLKVLGFGSGAEGNPADVPKGISACLMSTMQLIQESITSTATVTSAAAAVAVKINDYVLQPLAFVVSGNLLRLMTQGVIAFVIGKTNGTGVPQFVADIQASLQTVSDAHTLGYFEQFMRNSQSPWDTSIISELHQQYLNETSLEGFWAANMDTLRYTSPYAFGYLNGNWAQGGVTSWFALTTQFQNNPYMLFQSTRSALASILGPGVGGALGARLQDITNGNGVVSWCGNADDIFGLGELPSDPVAQGRAASVDQAASNAYDQAYNAAIAAGQNADAAGSAAYDTAKAAALAAGQSELQATQAAIDARRAAIDAAHARAANATTEALAAQTAAKNAAFAQAKAANAGNTFLGVAPGDPCTNKDGTTGTIKTPGSVIVATLNKALGGQQDNVVRMGNVGPEINNILANIGVVLQTANLAAQILGGPGSTGLLGVNQPYGGNSVSPLRQYANSSGNLGVTNSTVVQNTAATFALSGSDVLARVAKYETAVNTIRDAANTASTSVNSLLSYCTAQQQTASSTGSSFQTQISNAHNTLTNSIAPILAQTDAAAAIIASTRALVQKIQSEQASITDAAAAAYAVDIQALQDAPPSPTAVANAQRSAIRSSVEQTLPTAPPSVANFAASQKLQISATSSPAAPLTVSGGTLVDQLDLIAKNATALKSSCAAP